MKIRKPIPYEFVIDKLERLSPLTRPMFGCIAVYVGEKIVFVLRERETEPQDNGVWIATQVHAFDFLKSIRTFCCFYPQ